MLGRVRDHEKIWDLVIIGGGATGIGCALDAASRGFEVLLLEQSDFGKGTSSRSTKLVHGGVRYLAQGNVSLVRESLKERGLLFRNAPHLVEKQAFVVPVYSYWDKFFYGAGLKTYNILSGKYGFGKSEILSREETIKRLPNVRKENLSGGILYFDGRFDDARLLVNLAQTAAEQGAALLNYARVFALNRDRQGKIDGAAVSDEITGQIFLAKARIVVNAAGAFCDAVRKFSDKTATNIIAPSQGVHLVVDRRFLSSESALMVPKTNDERVLFAVPWHDHAIFGTTDTPLEKPELEPQALDREIEFILETAAGYLENPPRREDILSVFTGVRPLVRSENTATTTAALARDHTIEVDKSNLLTITGGKWTTYRRMAEDAVDQAIKTAGLPEKKCVTETLKIHGAAETAENQSEFGVYGADAAGLEKLVAENPALAEPLHPALPYRRAEIVWAVRNEMAETVEDVLARRTRALFLNAKAALAIAPAVAELMVEETSREFADRWIEEQLRHFSETARHFLAETAA
ncbi:MAG: glycerol-3-phosphate dehydrogenase/oxidase [Acidobacteria bacterium]|nr:glycerol-3-phosphate dehydrogenase/oxidase [Acidobacteriota bacterium]